ncbi:MAG: hypothetical protein PHW15_02575 [Patescibacteria group bacterium]|nr:hypothetical protein [Patescibacteria group bacterium]MDD5172856.1 hypothetical protein [Patescibacteria group bacterium]
MKIKIIAIFIFVILLFPGKLFASAAPIEEKYWCGNFVSSGSCDRERSNVDWENKTMVLNKRDDNTYSSSSICWTNEIRFGKHIHSITNLSGVYSSPGGTSVKAFFRFGDAEEEYLLNWGGIYEPKEAFKSFRLKIFLASNNSAVSPNVSQICFKVRLQDRSIEGIKSRDRTRVSNLEKTKNVLKKYYEDFNQYPVVDIQPTEKQRQWDLLKNTLSSASFNHYENYTRGFIDQPENVSEDYQYGYLTSSLGLYYLLWTKLEDINSERFENSWTGEILNVDCSPPIYCIYSRADADPEVLLKEFNNKQKKENIEDAEFIRTPDDSKVWLKTKNRRVWLRTPEIFNQANGNWDKITIKNTLADVPLLKFIKFKDKEEIYLVSEKGFKRHMSNSQILNFYGQISEIVVFDNEKIINLLPENRLIKGKGLSEVYFLDQKIKRWITSPEVFAKMGFDWNEVVEVDPRELDYYPEATPMF